MFRRRNRGLDREDDYHELRIRIKEARTVLEIVDSCYRNGPPRLSLNHRLRGRRRELGGWHDAGIALADLYRAEMELRSFALFDPNAYRIYSAGLILEKARRLRAFRWRWERFGR